MSLFRRNLSVSTWFFCFCVWQGAATAQVPTVTIGQNFAGSTYNNGANGGNSSALPPDPNGAIGPVHFVEFINGAFAAYNKTNGHAVKRISDLIFWSQAGVVLSASQAISDPRIIYDPTSQRWFASMVDFDANASDPTAEANDFLLAVSATSDPTGTWHGWQFQADPDNGSFADFPTLGVDSNAVYISGDMFTNSVPVGPSLVSIPKTDLLAASPVITNRTWFGVMDYGVRGQVLQPVICLDGSSAGNILAASDIGNDSDPHSNLVSSVVLNAATTNASLGQVTVIPTASWVVPYNDIVVAPQFTANQPDATSTLDADDARITAKVYAVGGVLYATHNTELNNRIAIEWYRIRASDHVLLESGTISDPNLDLFYPSIAANAYGVVVICFNGSGSNAGATISSFALAGQTINGTTGFGSRILLQTGAISYHGDDEQIGQLLGTPTLSRWGDYSATSVDPSNPNRFWTIQMFPSDASNNDVWSTQITELVTTPQFPLLTIQPSGRNVLVSWPSGFAGYHLQSEATLAPPPTWSSVTNTPATNGNQLVVTLPASARQQFFRLQKP
jgi:hypothetical protein